MGYQMRVCRQVLTQVIVLSLAAVATACGVQRVHIEGQAMAPTLEDGESALVIRDMERLERGDVVAFRYPRDESKNFLQRIIGLPGDELASSDGYVSLNGAPLDEPYVDASKRSHDTWGPRTLGEDEYFVMGDNRGNSMDSRVWGTVHRSAIWGRVVLR